MSSRIKLISTFGSPLVGDGEGNEVGGVLKLGAVGVIVGEIVGKKLFIAQTCTINIKRQ